MGGLDAVESESKDGSEFIVLKHGRGGKKGSAGPEEFGPARLRRGNSLNRIIQSQAVARINEGTVTKR
jgi:hypothetical protein